MSRRRGFGGSQRGRRKDLGPLDLLAVFCADAAVDGAGSELGSIQRVGETLLVGRRHLAAELFHGGVGAPDVLGRRRFDHV